jgi:putative copper resistance protein D
VAGFLDVLLRGLSLCGQAAAIGGVLFAVIVLRPTGGGQPTVAGSVQSVLRLIALGGAVAIAAQILALITQLGALADDGGWPVSAAISTAFFQTSLVKMLVCAAIALVAAVARRRGHQPSWGALSALAGLLTLAVAGTSHAAARLEHRDTLLVLDALHQFAAAVWIGGLLQLVALAARDRRREPWPAATLQRFSAMALGAVALLIASGMGMSLYYIDGLNGLLGTGYGLMVLTKATALAGLCALGAMNFFTVRSLATAPGSRLLRLRRFVEVELGLGLTVLFAAASLTSLPPAVDLVADRATLGEVATRFTPRWPRLSSPPIEMLPVGDRETPRTDADRAWSEYNHHIAGLFVLAMGLLALAHRFGTGWARHWPLLFLGMAAFLLVRNDPGAWPLGPEGFWESMRHPEVLQHRLFVLLVVAFGVFEWMVRMGRLHSPRYALIFPVLCVVGGGLLLTHSHAALNLKAEYLIEVTHAPLGLLALAAGWGRWLELRLPTGEDSVPGRVWAVAMAAIGALLLLYRES